MLGNRREIFWPDLFSLNDDFNCSLSMDELPMAFSPNNTTAVLAYNGRIFFVDVVKAEFIGWTQRLEVFDIITHQYSPDGDFVLAVGHDGPIGAIRLVTKDALEMLTFCRDDKFAGEYLPAIDILAFSWCSSKVACVASGTPHIYIMPISSR